MFYTEHFLQVFWVTGFFFFLDEGLCIKKANVQTRIIFRFFKLEHVLHCMFFYVFSDHPGFCFFWFCQYRKRKFSEQAHCTRFVWSFWGSFYMIFSGSLRFWLCWQWGKELDSHTRSMFWIYYIGDLVFCVSVFDIFLDLLGFDAAKTGRWICIILIIALLIFQGQWDFYWISGVFFTIEWKWEHRNLFIQCIFVFL